LHNHLRRLFEKLGVDDRTQAAMEAVKRGIIRPP
jgi:DNA-binding NarL/FixJ family response regulator